MPELAEKGGCILAMRPTVRTLAGPLADDKGGLFVYYADCREEAMSYLRQDPLALKGVFADYEFLEWFIEGITDYNETLADTAFRWLDDSRNFTNATCCARRLTIF